MESICPMSERQESSYVAVQDERNLRRPEESGTREGAASVYSKSSKKYRDFSPEQPSVDWWFLAEEVVSERTSLSLLLSIFPLSRAARAVRAVRVTSQFRHSSRGRHSDAVRRFVQPQPGDGQHPPPGVQDVNARDESESAAEMSQSEKVRFFSDAIRLLTYFHES